MTMYRDPNLSVGGPIRKDKMWYFFSFRDQQTGVTVPGFPADKPSDFEFPTRLTNLTYKVNYQLSRGNRLGHYIQWGRKFQPHRGASSTAYSDAPFRQDSWSWAANLDWNSVVNSRFVHNARYSTFGYDWPNYPYGVGGEVNENTRRRMTDSLTGNTAGAAAWGESANGEGRAAMVAPSSTTGFGRCATVPRTWDRGRQSWSPCFQTRVSAVMRPSRCQASRASRSAGPYSFPSAMRTV